MNIDVSHPAQIAQRASLTTFAALIAMVALCGPPAQAAIAIRTFNGWTLYSETAQQQICFLAAFPAETAPAGLKRDPALLYISAWPKDGVECSLSDVLETQGDHLKKYSLSAKAAQGILRRANRREKTLPPQLQIALEQVAQSQLSKQEDTKA
jgi:hypothetical protein